MQQSYQLVILNITKSIKKEEPCDDAKKQALTQHELQPRMATELVFCQTPKVVSGKYFHCNVPHAKKIQILSKTIERKTICWKRYQTEIRNVKQICILKTTSKFNINKAPQELLLTPSCPGDYIDGDSVGCSVLHGYRWLKSDFRYIY